MDNRQSDFMVYLNVKTFFIMKLCLLYIVCQYHIIINIIVLISHDK